MPPGEDFNKFQDAIWRDLPMRKWLCGQERVNDCVAIMVQEWPDEQFAMSEAGTVPQAVVVKGLMQSMKRHLHLSQGETQFGIIWTIILQALLYEIVVLILKWWKEKKAHRMDMLKWQKFWRSEGGE